MPSCLLSGPLCAIMLAAQPAPAPTTPATTPAITPPSAAPAPAPPPPALLLGDRVARQQQQTSVLDVLVLVPDGPALARAIAAWSPAVRFPVLIDDGSLASIEDIARFQRAFRASRVVRWQPDAASTTPAPAITAATIQAALNESWDLPTDTAPADFASTLRAREGLPLGVVVVDPADPAWPAGLALAAARGQPIIALPTLGPVGGVLSPLQTDELSTSITTQLDAWNLPWQGLGTDVDAITIAANFPTRYAPDATQTFSLSDRLGRKGSHTGPAGDKQLPERWAWAGQVFGTAREATFRAMAALFAAPLTDGAWMFNGYPATGPWAAYSFEQSAQTLRNAGLSAELVEAPKGSAVAWRDRAARPVEAPLVLVNTKGNADFFDLEPGTCRPGDVPLLSRPALVSFIHSWSAMDPSNPGLIAGRWLRHGAYAYVGSVHEPYLQAFLPPNTFLARLGLGAPLGAAARHDAGPVWKIAVLGDPLTMLGHPPTRSSAPLPLTGATEVGTNLRELLQADQFEEAFRTMALLGRDADVARLAPAVRSQKLDKLTPAAAQWAILPLFRERRDDELVAYYGLLDAGRATDPILRDALWLSAYPRLTTNPSLALLNVLSSNLRPDNLARDAAFLAGALRRARGGEAATALIEQARAQVPQEQRADFEQVLRSAGER